MFTAVVRQMSGFEPPLRCFCAFFDLLCAFISVGEWVNMYLSNVPFTAVVGLQMSGVEPLFSLFLCVSSLCFQLFCLEWVRGASYCC